MHAVTMKMIIIFDDGRFEDEKEVARNAQPYEITQTTHKKHLEEEMCMKYDLSHGRHSINAIAYINPTPTHSRKDSGIFRHTHINQQTN